MPVELELRLSRSYSAQEQRHPCAHQHDQGYADHVHANVDDAEVQHVLLFVLRLDVHIGAVATTALSRYHWWLNRVSSNLDL